MTKKQAIRRANRLYKKRMKLDEKYKRKLHRTQTQLTSIGKRGDEG